MASPVEFETLSILKHALATGVAQLFAARSLSPCGGASPAFRCLARDVDPAYSERGTLQGLSIHMGSLHAFGLLYGQGERELLLG